MKLPLSPENLSVISESITHHCIERITESGSHHFNLEEILTLDGKRYILSAEVIVDATIRVNQGSWDEAPSDESHYRFDVREDVLLSDVHGDDDTYIHWKIIQDFIKKSV